MLKSNLIVKSPSELNELQHFFHKEIEIPDQRFTPINFPFYNFVCYTIDILNDYVKSSLDVTLNVFIVDIHLRKYVNNVELYRRFSGFINSWKKYSEKDEAKLLLTLLRPERNHRKSIKLFLKLRKILLKNINQKILQEIQLSHQDAVTIVHTLDNISVEQRKILTKKINQYFITKNIKYVNSAKFNAAIICEYFMTEINDKGVGIDKFNSNISNKMAKLLKNQLEFIEEFSEQTIPKKQISFCFDSLVPQFQSNKTPMLLTNENKGLKQNSNQCQSFSSDGNKPLVNLQKCMKQLYILKQKDMEIDNRFKKLNKSREQL